jgi:hypothetical protein
MIDRHIDHLESRIRNAEGLSDERRGELLGLIESLRREAASLPPEVREKLEVAAPDDRPVDDVVTEIQGSLTGFEASHPKLTQLTNQIAVVLSNMGI